MSMSSASVGHAPRRGARAPPASAAATWRSKLPGPNARLDRVRRGSSERVRARAVAVGHDRDARPSGRVAQQAVQLAAVEQRRVARHEQHAVEAARERVRIPISAASDWPAWRCRARTVTRSPVRDGPAACRRSPPPPRRAPGLGGAWRARRRTSPGRGPGAIAAAEHAGKALLGSAEALDGEDGDRAMAGRAAYDSQPLRRAGEVEHLAAPAAARPGALHERVGHERRQAARTGSSATSPSTRRRRRAATPAALRLDAGVLAERLRRALHGAPAHERAHGHHRRRRRASASRIPGRARIGPIEITGLDGPITIASARGDRLEHLGGRPRPLDARAARPPRPGPRRARRS